MDYETLKWIKAIHIFTILTWAGSLAGLSFILKQHAKATKEAYPDFKELEKGVAMIMDIGAMIAMITGVIMILQNPSIMKSGGWIHAKLTLVIILLGLHGFQRMRVGKFKKDKVSTKSNSLVPIIIEAIILSIVLLAVAKPF